MRRWKRIKDGNFKSGSILVLERDDNTGCSSMMCVSNGHMSYAQTEYMVEIDEYGKTIRIYEHGDKLNEGTLIGGTMYKAEIMKKVEALEKETAALRKLVAEDKLVYKDDGVIYVAVYDGYTSILVGKTHKSFYGWFVLTDSSMTYSSHTSGQEALDDMLNRGGIIHTYTNRKDALSFFYNNCEE